MKEEIKFSDGSRIYRERNNWCVKFSLLDADKEKIKRMPEIKDLIENSSYYIPIKGNRFYYFQFLSDIAKNLPPKEKDILFDKLKWLCDVTTTHYDETIVNEDFLNKFGRYFLPSKIHSAINFVLIYLDMIECENYIMRNGRGVDKNMLLNECKAVIYENISPEIAARMYERKKEEESDDDYYEDYDGQGEQEERYEWTEEDTWYAMTDGMYGDYPGGNVDYEIFGF